MPILAYFTVVGALLTGLLFAADAYLPTASPAIASSNFTGLPPAWKGPVQQSTTVVAEAPEPDMNSAAVRAANPVQESSKTHAAQAQIAQSDVPAPIKRKKLKPRHEPEWHNHFASGWSQPQTGWGQNNWQQNRRPVERRAQQSQPNSFWR